MADRVAGDSILITPTETPFAVCPTHRQNNNNEANGKINWAKIKLFCLKLCIRTFFVTVLYRINQPDARLTSGSFSSSHGIYSSYFSPLKSLPQERPL